jgi:uvrD/REP helicase
LNFVTSEQWSVCDGINLEKIAYETIKANRNVLVIAGPGTGKTELLAQKACYLFQTNICRNPHKILAICFKNDAADNLKKRVLKRCGKEIENRFVSITYDAFSKKILDRFRCALPQNMRPDSLYVVNDTKVIAAAFREAGFNNPNNLKGFKLNEFYENVLKTTNLPCTGDSLGEKVWRLLLKGFSDYAPTLSFKMICILAEYIIRTNPKIKRVLQYTYKYVFLDEFQDTTNLQYELVKQCFLDSGSVVTAVGDNKQRIMVWAGALKTVFKDFEEEFNADKLTLTINHRSAPRLVDLQKRMYESLNAVDDRVEVSDKRMENDGDITLLVANDEEREAEVISEHISKKIKAGIKPNELCILCKQKPGDYAKEVINHLNKKKIYARLEDNYQNLLKEPITEILLSIFQLAISKAYPQGWTFIVEITAKLWNIDFVQSDDEYIKMQDRLYDKIQELKDVIINVKCKNDFNNLIKNIIVFFGVKQIQALFPVYKQRDYLITQLIKFQDYMWLELEETEFDWILAMDRFLGFYSVPIMTIHKSKGLEYDTVYFIGLEDSAFWNFKKQPEEDRCAFFVALSRAKNEVLFTFCKHRSLQKYPKQSHNQINEFFDLLIQDGVANIIK